VEASELALASAAEQAAAIAEGQISSEELVRAYLDRISAYNPNLNALVTMDAEAALAEARRRDRQLAAGGLAGPLHGLPISVKDALTVAGMRSTGGIPRYAEHVPDRDAEAVGRVREAGGVILGKTNMPTANADFQSRNPVFGISNNPWDRSRTPGGSCGGGGAAVAAGLSSLELGSEIGGSLRIPAHFCGLYAHKSSFRTCPMTGHIPPGPESPGRDVSEFDLAVIGGIARSSADLELLLQSLAGPPAEEARAWSLVFPPPRATELEKFRIAAWFDDPFAPLDGEVGAVLDQFVDRLEAEGAEVDRAPALPTGLRNLHEVYEALLFAAFGGDPNNSILSPQSAAYFLLHAARHPRGQASRARKYMEQKHKKWFDFDRHRFQLLAKWQPFFDSYDVLLMPITGTVAPPHHNMDHNAWGRSITVNGRRRNYFEQSAWNGVANLLRSPATAVPAGRTKAGLPVGLQIMGPAYEDLTTLAFASCVEHRIGGFVSPNGYTLREPQLAGQGRGARPG
jgi:amidase